MEQSPETAPTASNGDVDAEETIVIKKPAAAVSATKESDETAAATIKVEQKTPEASNESESEEVIVEEVEESEPTTSESEKEDTEVIQKPSVETAPKKEIAPVAKEAVVVQDKVAVENKDAESSIEEEEVEEEIEEVEEEEEDEEEEAKEEVKKEVVESNKTTKAESPKADEKDGHAAVTTNVQLETPHQSKQENVNNTIKEIISDIDCNIREQERIASLKQEELKLLQKQQELAQQIKEQQLLAQRLASQNDKLQQQYQQQQQQQQQSQPQPQSHPQPQQPQQLSYQKPYERQQPAVKFEPQQQTSQPLSSVSRYSTFEETKDGNVITQKTSSYEAEESSNVTKRIDLQKIFTPATDAEEILPRNRKLYASSAFFTPGIHPTVEDQVELARRISHSLSDISNHQSKGQSMYVNRKKRSVKWVHEGQGEEEEEVEEISEEQYKENAQQQSEPKHSQTLDKLPLRLLMNPRGQVIEYNSLRDQLNIETGLLSPEKCAELVTALHTQKGRGAELFAKRRKKSDKWIVDEQNASTQNPSGLPDFHTYQGQVPPKPPASPSIVPAYSDVGKQRVQLNLHQEQVLEKYARPGLQVVKSPWEAALETGSASAAFMEGGKSQHAMTPTPSPAPIYESTYNQNAYSAPPAPEYQQNNQQPKYSKPSSFNDHQKDLAYKPSLAQGWKAPSVSLPKASENIYDENFYEFGDNRLQMQFNQYEESECSSVSCYEADCNLEVMGFNAPQCSQPIQIPNSKLPTAECQAEKYERVDVRKQLLQLEQRMQEVARLRQQQERLRNRRERNQQKWTWQQKQANLQQNHNGENACDHERTEEEKRVDEQEEYIKIAVRDLIESFEQQTIQPQQDDRPKANEETQKNVSKPDFGDLKGVMCNQQELYMPKEIPIESYAPPPVVNLKPTSPYSPIYQSQENQHTWTPAYSPAPATISPSPYDDYSYSKPTPVDHSSAFPIVNKPAPKPQYGGGGSNFPVSANVPPKQQYLEPTSYQKVQQPSAGQRTTQVNFNPSPLPYDKLAKFENPENSSDTFSQPRYLAPSYGHGSKVRNVSPAPFGAKSPVSLPYSPPMQQYSNYGNTSYSPSIPSSTPTYGHHNPNELLHGPTFNNAARGWKTSGGGVNSFYAKPRAPLTTGANMHYTDF